MHMVESNHVSANSPSLVEVLVAHLERAFQICILPPRAFKDEADLGAHLFPAMRASAGELRLKAPGRRVPCFLSPENRVPDAEVTDGAVTVAVELKILIGQRNRDGGEVHRGLGQCLTYISSPTYLGSVLLVVHDGYRPGIVPRVLSKPPAAIELAASPPRRGTMFSRLHHPDQRKTPARVLAEDQRY